MYVYTCSPPPAPYDTRKCMFCPFIHNSYQATVNDCKNPKILKSKTPKIQISKKPKIQESKTFHIYGILQKKTCCLVFFDFWIFRFWFLLICFNLGCSDVLICVVFFGCFVFCLLAVLWYTFLVFNVFLRAPKIESNFRCTEKAEFTIFLVQY